MPTTYDADAEGFNADAYTVRGYSGIAWRVLGWGTEPLTRTGCTGCDYEGRERAHGGGYVIEKHSPECPDDAELFTDDEPEFERTGQVIAVMVGDNRQFSFDSEALTPITEADYCAGCGQTGCTAEARA